MFDGWNLGSGGIQGHLQSLNTAIGDLIDIWKMGLWEASEKVVIGAYRESTFIS